MLTKKSVIVTFLLLLWSTAIKATHRRQDLLGYGSRWMGVHRHMVRKHGSKQTWWLEWKAESSYLNPQASKEHTGKCGSFGNLKAGLQWHSCSSKATHPKHTQRAHQLGTKYSHICVHGGCSYQTATEEPTASKYVIVSPHLLFRNKDFSTVPGSFLLRSWNTRSTFTVQYWIGCCKSQWKINK